MYCSAEVEAKEAEAKRAREAAEAKAKEEEVKFGYWQQEFGCWKGMLMRIFGIALVWLILQFDVIPLTLEFAKRYWPFFYFSPIFLAIFLDYRWAYEDEAHGLWPKFSFPKSKADGCMALVGLFLKGLLLTSGFFPIMFMRIAEGILFVGQYTLILVCWAIIVISIWTPTLFSKQCPTMKNLCQQYHVERSTGLDFTADIRQNCKYLKENCKTLAVGICRVPLLLCNPLLCVTTLKAAVLLYFVNVFCTFFLLSYFSFRIGVAAYTYKLFTFVGWSDELVQAIVWTYTLQHDEPHVTLSYACRIRNEMGISP